MKTQSALHSFGHRETESEIGIEQLQTIRHWKCIALFFIFSHISVSLDFEDDTEVESVQYFNLQ